jgi:phospholipase C
MNPQELRDKIDTIVVVTMENRSFDHIYGHRSMPAFGGHANVDGVPNLQDPNLQNPAGNGSMVSPFIASDKDGLPTDLPHERDIVAKQLARSAALGGFAMNGFVTAYEQYTATTGKLRSPPMGLLTAPDLPTSSFLADEYMICDRWFAPLPASTHPNRLMSICGYTLNDVTRAKTIPRHRTVFDWLEERGIRWRVYSAGISFYMLMPQMWPAMLTEHFRQLANLSFDAQHETNSNWPQVVFIEPDYGDSPVHLSGHANDNHPPLPVAFGEAFLRRIYEALTANPARWGKTALIVTYDEHGGFFDHVQPLPIPYVPPPNATFTAPFDSTGVRVPTVIASPFVGRGAVSKVHLDHTSILQLIAERFGKGGETYSPEVDARRAAGIASVSAVLDAQANRATVPVAPDTAINVTASLATTIDPKTDGQNAFVVAMEEFAKTQGTAGLAKFPQIAHWMTP